MPGDLVIADDSKNHYHTMLLTDFYDEGKRKTLNGREYKMFKGDPLVTYSRGKGYAGKNLVKDAPLKGYIDQSHGKNNVRYYRFLNKKIPEVVTPPIVVTPQGNYIDSTNLVNTVTPLY